MTAMMETCCNDSQEEEGGGTNVMTAAFIEYVEKLPWPHVILPNDKCNGSIAMTYLSSSPSLI